MGVIVQLGQDGWLQSWSFDSKDERKKPADGGSNPSDPTSL